MKWILWIVILGNVGYTPKQQVFDTKEECLIEAKKVADSVEKTGKQEGCVVCLEGYPVKEDSHE